MGPTRLPLASPVIARPPFILLCRGVAGAHEVRKGVRHWKFKRDGYALCVENSIEATPGWIGGRERCQQVRVLLLCVGGRGRIGSLAVDAGTDGGGGMVASEEQLLASSSPSSPLLPSSIRPGLQSAER
jgi:hypothetical protein